MEQGRQPQQNFKMGIIKHHEYLAIMLGVTRQRKKLKAVPTGLLEETVDEKDEMSEQ